MAEQVIYQDEYIPYTDEQPRRSTRQRSVVNPIYNPVPKMKSSQPQKRTGRTPAARTPAARTPAARTPAARTAAVKQRSRTRSIPRDADYYTADDVPQAPRFAQLKRDVKNQMFAAGVTRIPLLTEVSKISVHIIAMRWEEIHLLRDAIEMMKKGGIAESLYREIQKGVNILEWEMDSRNVREDDLPPLGPETTNFADISTWCIFYYDMLHENMHRIIDLNYAMTMLSKSDRKKLAVHEKNAHKILSDFEKDVVEFKIEGESQEAYERVVDEIIQNCPVCK